MKDIVAGFDGSTRDALRALPRQACEDRAHIENMGVQLGTVLDAYLHVPNPMLP